MVEDESVESADLGALRWRGMAMIGRLLADAGGGVSGMTDAGSSGKRKNQDCCCNCRRRCLYDGDRHPAGKRKCWLWVPVNLTLEDASWTVLSPLTGDDC